MKILHYVPDLVAGGVDEVIFYLSRHALSKGHTVEVMTSNPDVSLYETTMKKYTDLGIPIIVSKYANRYNPLRIFELKKYFMNYDIVHVHLFPNQLQASCAHRLIKKSKRPVLVTTEHNTWNNRRNHNFFKHLDRWYYKKYDYIVSISNQTAVNLKVWLDSKKIADKMSTIINGIDLSRFRNAKDTLGEVLNKEAGVRYVVMVSRLEHPKDPVTLVRAISRCTPDIHGVIIGYGTLEKDVENEAKALGISDRIHLLGKRIDVHNLLKGCDLGVLSTHWDGFGLVAVEYMAAGLPVLTTDVDGLRDVVGNSEYLFKTGDDKTLASKISLLLNDSDAHAKAMEYFRHRPDLFSCDRMGTEYLDLYSSLLKNR